MFEAMTADELDALAVTGRWPDRPEPAPGTSRFDTMSEADVRNLWNKHRRRFAGRSAAELEMFAVHGHWPEQGCGKECPISGQSNEQPGCPP